VLQNLGKNSSHFDAVAISCVFCSGHDSLRDDAVSLFGMFVDPTDSLRGAGNVVRMSHDQFIDPVGHDLGGSVCCCGDDGPAKTLSLAVVQKLHQVSLLQYLGVAMDSSELEFARQTILAACKAHYVPCGITTANQSETGASTKVVR
jgi:hypothetical protein